MRILDLYCGAGGAAMGYHQEFPEAEIIGVDINPQPNYPFKFLQADALSVELSGFDFIHASPPCQAHTTMSAPYRGKGGLTDKREDFIFDTRVRLYLSGTPYAIENVTGANKKMIDPIMLTGGMFGLKVHRPRPFECSFPVVRPKWHQTDREGLVAVYGQNPGGRVLWKRKDGTKLMVASTLEEAQAAMGIDWMTWLELIEAVPPAYTRYIAKYLRAYLESES